MKLAVIIGIFLGFVGASVWLLSPVSRQSQPGVFAVPEKVEDFDVVQKLEEGKFIRNAPAFRLLLGVFASGKPIDPGGYRLDPAMNAWQVLQKVTADPELLWVTVSGCRRKEEIADLIDQTIGWTDDTLNKWVDAYRDLGDEYVEGVYYPDTYLIPKDATGTDVANMFINRFNEEFSPLADIFIRQNIKWTTGLKIASLIAREAAGESDMNLISGIIWNRLDRGMKLEVDATMQYTKGRREDGSWWGGIDLAEKRNDSLYNTYLHTGLPPTPICSPGIDAITAVLEPEETDCFYYLHDRNKQIHCAETYGEHKANIQEYL